MKYTLHDLIQARGVSEPLREAVVALVAKLEAAEKERDALRTNVERMEKIESAAQNLVKMRGRHNTEIAYQRLVAALENLK